MTQEQVENVKKWIAALRSGEYEQGRYALRQRQLDGRCRYCCLGVLIDTMDPSVWLGEENTTLYSVEDNYSSIPIPLYNKWVAGSIDQGELIAKNDRRTPFSLIADIIEKSLE